MEKEATIIRCPKCDTPINVSDVLYDQLQVQIKKDFEAKNASKDLEYEKKLKDLKEKQNQIVKDKEALQEQVESAVKSKLKQEKSKLETTIRQQIEDEKSEQLKSMEKELNLKSEQLKELNKTKADNTRLQREKDELADKIKAEEAVKFSELLLKEKEIIKKGEEEKNELKLREMQKQLDDQKRLTEEMKKKQEQGSMQMQGEVMELAIEEWLKQKFPLDTIEEIKKGARGADCVQIVNTHYKQNCGSIYYESKRTNDFKKEWIEKFKGDIREKGANIGVLVTATFPKDMDRMGLKDGVWICNFEEFKGLCGVIRESIIQINNAMISQENKGDKMSLLYDYLTSDQFRIKVEAIVEGFTSMKAQILREQMAMNKQWKEREKQLEKVITNTIDMYGSVRGIAGNAVQEVKALELPVAESDLFLEEKNNE